MMAEKKEDQQMPSSSNMKSWLNRRAFVGALVALFGAVNVWVFGKRNHWWRPRHEVVVSGPFSDDIPVLIGKTESDFVTPKSIRLDARNRSKQIKIAVQFEFKGKKKKDRRINVQVAALDANDRIIGSFDSEAGDMRLAETIQFGAFPATVSPVCSVSGKVPKPLNGTSDISRVQLQFVEL